MVVLETNCEASIWELWALPVAGAAIYTLCMVTLMLCNATSDIVLSLKVVTVELGFGNKLDTRLGTGRRKIIPIMKNSLKKKIYLNCISCSHRKEVKQAKMKNKLILSTMLWNYFFNMISSRRGELSICLERNELVSHTPGPGKGLSSSILEGTCVFCVWEGGSLGKCVLTGEMDL